MTMKSEAPLRGRNPHDLPPMFREVQEMRRPRRQQQIADLIVEVVVGGILLAVLALVVTGRL